MAMAAPAERKDIHSRNYEAAIRIINSRQRAKRPITAATWNDEARNSAKQSGTPGLRGAPAIAGMREWLSSIGHSVDDLNGLNVIHVAGTKGKGSTCALTESFLRAHGRRTGHPQKTGLYTSPHLILPEERIRINSQPLPPDLFAKYFFEVYDRLPQLSQEYDPSLNLVTRGPRYLQIFALLAFHVFLQEKVDVAILETHCGGEFDATNVVEKPAVTAITTLGMDHVDMLGPTIENIAWHKAGIFKKGAMTLSARQDPAPASVLSSRSREKDQKLRFVDVDPRLPVDCSALKPEVQKKNASLAAAAADAFLDRCEAKTITRLTEQDLADGIEQLSWPGRFQTIRQGSYTWLLDSAHNEMSVKVAAEWYAACLEEQSSDSKSQPRILIFSHINELRDAAALLGQLGTALQDNGVDMDHIIFSTYDESDANKTSHSAHNSEPFRTIWKAIEAKAQLWNEPTIQGAIALARRLGPDGMHTLITGSQHLVGPSLRILNWSEGPGR